MTLQNGLIHRGKGYLWTDTALWDARSGQCIGEVAKAFTGTTWPWMGVLSGAFDPRELYRVPQFISRAIPRTKSELFDVACQALRVEMLQGRIGRILFCVPDPDFGAMLYFIAADDVGFAKPFAPFEAIEFMSSRVGEGLRDPCPQAMRSYIGRQERQPGETVFGSWRHTIGGNIVELELCQSRGVTSRVLRPALFRPGKTTAPDIHVTV